MRIVLGVLVVAVCLAPVASAAPVASTAAADGAASNAQVTITVSVVDQNGDPVEDANVTVTYNDTVQTGETFANGKAFFDVPEGADVTVDVSKDGLALNRPASVQGVDGETVVDVQLFPAATADRPLETPDGQPIEGARVHLEKDDEVLAAATGETAANGTFVATDLERGDYSVALSADGYYSTSTTFVVRNRAGKTVTMEPGTVSVEVQTVDGHVSDSRPVSATVELYEGDQFVSNVSTGDSGSRTVSLDVNTQYSVVVKKNGYERERHTLTTGETDTNVTYSINRTPSLSLSAANSQVVTGQTVQVSVTDEYDEPVSGASIRVDGETVTETDDAGEAMVTIESDGEVTITAVSGSLEASTTVEGVSPATDQPTTTTTTTTTAPTTTSETAMPTTSETATTAAEPDDGDGDGVLPTPGFGGAATLLAVLLSVAVLAGRRRR
jgi:uncharacterized GH25 family protein